MKLIHIFFTLSIFTNTTNKTFAVQTHPEILHEFLLDYDDIESHLSEIFEEQCSTSQNKKKSFSPEQHLKNVNFIFQQEEISTEIYEFLFGKTNSTQVNLETAIQVISQSSSDDTIPVVAFFFSDQNNINDPLQKSILQFHDVATTRSLCKKAEFREQLNLHNVDGTTMLHTIAAQNLLDENVRKIIATLINSGANVFEKDGHELIPFEVTENEEIKTLLLSAMRHRPCKYISYQRKNLPSLCNCCCGTFSMLGLISINAGLVLMIYLTAIDDNLYVAVKVVLSLSYVLFFIIFIKLCHKCYATRL